MEKKGEENMGSKFCRVVTGHDDYGNSLVKFNDIIESGSYEDRTGGTDKTSEFSLLWSTATFPSDNGDDTVAVQQEVGLTSPGGTVFRMVDFYPGKSSPMHRTRSLDYGIIIDGEVELELDNGTTVELKRGDVIVQRGTIHAWHNKTDKICRIAFVFIDAKEIQLGGQTLQAL